MPFVTSKVPINRANLAKGAVGVLPRNSFPLSQITCKGDPAIPSAQLILSSNLCWCSSSGHQKAVWGLDYREGIPQTLVVRLQLDLLV